ncbi:hypothetical protein NNJEOMEG_00358 [Fundidesulfovibrio magnetotacticus]|uniref:Uncharacterized protein n=1 Tax=Fundidesulfovibrio magnetotacticus TaxID=2730080 RepID=A0A6V8LIJ1_9BACT|nr:alpha/beta hydrolase [Fundidesulfovibrio magnetotacticus]GFK92533.1 hypothetical protein NNJEOMEG_00358 [Fundidesulfovibrio magnetotacticus]
MAKVFFGILLALCCLSSGPAGASGAVYKGTLRPGGGGPPMGVALVLEGTDSLQGYLALEGGPVLHAQGPGPGALRLTPPCPSSMAPAWEASLARAGDGLKGSLTALPGAPSPCGALRVPGGRVEFSPDRDAPAEAVAERLARRFAAESLRLAGEGLLAQREAAAFDAVESLEAALAVARLAFPDDPAPLAVYVEPLVRAYVLAGDIPSAKALAASYAEQAALPPPAARRLEAQAEPALSRGAAEERQYDLVRVHYATDRERTATQEPMGRFGSAPAAATSYGYCDVAVPRSHTPGVLEGPSLTSLTLSYDPSRHVTVTAVKEQRAGEFFRSIRDNVRDGRKDVLVFVHGYSVSFDRAVRRMAQMVHDMRFAGTPVVYSWPSEGLVQRYAQDAEKTGLSVPRLTAFVETLARDVQPANIHIIAHSMGNRVLLGALERLAASRGDGAGTLMRNVILAAPDVDSTVFRTRIAPRIAGVAQNATLYASSRDLAMVLSKLYNKAARLGDAQELVAVPPLDSIDASTVDSGLLGHSYYGQNHAVLDDMHLLIQGLKPPQRPLLVPARTAAGQDYWRFKTP